MSNRVDPLRHFESLSNDPTQAEVKAAFRKASMEAHPDAGGSGAAFRAVYERYAALLRIDRRATSRPSRRTKRARSAPAGQVDLFDADRAELRCHLPGCGGLTYSQHEWPVFDDWLHLCPHHLDSLLSAACSTCYAPMGLERYPDDGFCSEACQPRDPLPVRCPGCLRPGKTNWPPLLAAFVGWCSQPCVQRRMGAWPWFCYVCGGKIDGRGHCSDCYPLRLRRSLHKEPAS